MIEQSNDLKALIRKEHHQAELLRLRAGFDGCGCADCQTLYNELNFKKYGKRVIREESIIAITAGKLGADLWDKYHRPEYWTPGDNLFIVDGRKYGLIETGRTVRLGSMELTPDNADNHQNARNLVSKMADKEILLPATNGVFMKQRGRPRKEGKVSRATRWRREKEALQGALL